MTADTVGGVWSYCMELCNTLPDIHFHLVTAGAKLNEGQWNEIESLQNVCVYETEYKLEWMEKPWNDIDGSGEWLLRLEEEIQPHIIHLNSYSYGSLPFSAPKIIVAHSDVVSWWQAVNGEVPPTEWDEYFSRVKQGLDGADLIVAPSKAMRKSLQEIYGASAPSKVIYNGRSKNLFCTREKKPFIFCMGRIWDEAKNIELLIKAAPMIDYEIRIAGDQQFDRKSFGTELNNTQLLGRLNMERIAAELSEASLYVLPAKYEPFGLSALEAAYNGCALVLGDIPSLREIWKDAAVYVDVGDEEMLAKKINGLMQNAEELKRYQMKALARAENFSAAAMVAGYLEVYHELVQRKQVYQKQQTVL